MQPMNSSLPTVTLEQRLGLLWVRKHQPTGLPSTKDPDAPKRRTLIGLIRLGLVQPDPKRRRFDSMTYCLTDRGGEILG